VRILHETANQTTCKNGMHGMEWHGMANRTKLQRRFDADFDADFDAADEALAASQQPIAVFGCNHKRVKSNKKSNKTTTPPQEFHRNTGADLNDLYTGG
jgi:hypothetical protein